MTRIRFRTKDNQLANWALLLESLHERYGSNGTMAIRQDFGVGDNLWLSLDLPEWQDGDMLFWILLTDKTFGLISHFRKEEVQD